MARSLPPLYIFSLFFLASSRREWAGQAGFRFRCKLLCPRRKFTARWARTVERQSCGGRTRSNCFSRFERNIGPLQHEITREKKKMSKERELGKLLGIWSHGGSSRSIHPALLAALTENPGLCARAGEGVRPPWLVHVVNLS